jgi:hypothetical protein
MPALFICCGGLVSRRGEMVIPLRERRESKLLRLLREAGFWL